MRNFSPRLVALLLLCIGAAPEKKNDTEEVKILRSTVARQASQIESLRKEIARLEDVVAGRTTTRPSTRPASQPATQPGGSTVFILDATGSMQNRFEDAKNEVLRAIENLRPSQRFNVVVAHGDKDDSLSGGLMPATDANKDRVTAYLDRIAISGTDDMILPSFATAFQMKPDTIWFLSDGESSDSASCIAIIGRLHKGTKTRVNTVFLNEPDADGPRSYMFDLAAATGGKCIDHEGKLSPRSTVEVPAPLHRRKAAPSILD